MYIKYSTWDCDYMVCRKYDALESVGKVIDLLGERDPARYLFF